MARMKSWWVGGGADGLDEELGKVNTRMHEVRDEGVFFQMGTFSPDPAGTDTDLFFSVPTQLSLWTCYDALV